jgi:PhnB protein
VRGEMLDSARRARLNCTFLLSEAVAVSHLFSCPLSHRPGGAVRYSEMPETGYHTLTPRLVVNDVMGAVRFLRSVFDGEGEVHEDRPAEIRIGDSLVMVSGAGEREVFPAFLYVYVADADASFARALAAGAVTLEEPLDTPYGDRRAMLRDPFGNVFQIAHRR